MRSELAAVALLAGAINVAAAQSFPHPPSPDTKILISATLRLVRAGYANRAPNDTVSVTITLDERGTPEIIRDHAREEFPPIRRDVDRPALRRTVRIAIDQPIYTGDSAFVLLRRTYETIPSREMGSCGDDRRMYHFVRDSTTGWRLLRHWLAGVSDGMCMDPGQKPLRRSSPD